MVRPASVVWLPVAAAVAIAVAVAVAVAVAAAVTAVVPVTMLRGVVAARRVVVAVPAIGRNQIAEDSHCVPPETCYAWGTSQGGTWMAF
ncbi:predicted protein [Streptomyces viridosporus ATCC 14672]|uniref:Predicted protein n=1 Tax=Streptomyces viridosporus (strain ATCC 14672 / DSM 40746 / JCM 4963 / KCTC 9882 / NRRL B-12104 / FH 1290) TaxID=566461 RepID=D6A5D6_STRV1|nr:predicted protein [Streptomyces viridosporus ATCC 14672]